MGEQSVVVWLCVLLFVGHPVTAAHARRGVIQGVVPSNFTNCASCTNSSFWWCYSNYKTANNSAGMCQPVLYDCRPVAVKPAFCPSKRASLPSSCLACVRSDVTLGWAWPFNATSTNDTNGVCVQSLGQVPPSFFPPYVVAHRASDCPSQLAKVIHKDCAACSLTPNTTFCTSSSDYWTDAAKPSGIRGHCLPDSYDCSLVNFFSDLSLHGDNALFCAGQQNASVIPRVCQQCLNVSGQWCYSVGDSLPTEGVCGPRAAACPSASTISTTNAAGCPRPALAEQPVECLACLNSPGRVWCKPSTTNDNTDGVCVPYDQTSVAPCSSYSSTVQFQDECPFSDTLQFTDCKTCANAICIGCSSGWCPSAPSVFPYISKPFCGLYASCFDSYVDDGLFCGPSQYDNCNDCVDNNEYVESFEHGLVWCGEQGSSKGICVHDFSPAYQNSTCNTTGFSYAVRMKTQCFSARNKHLGLIIGLAVVGGIVVLGGMAVAIRNAQRARLGARQPLLSVNET